MPAKAAHEAFPLALAHRAVDDGRISDDERRELKTVASLLGVADSKVKQVADRRTHLVTLAFAANLAHSRTRGPMVSRRGFPSKRDRRTGKELREAYADTDEEKPRPVFELEAAPFPKKKGASRTESTLVSVWVESKWVMAFMGNVVLGVHEDHSLDNLLSGPQLILAASLGTPNKRIAEHTLSLLDLIRARGVKITRLSFDKGYTDLKNAKFHQPLRERRIPVVKDCKKGQVGITNGFGGADSVDGDWYCPSTPKDLLVATVRFNKKLITEDEWQRDIDHRLAYKLHVKEVMPNGKTVKSQCPALGASAMVNCPLREMHPKEEAKDDLEDIFRSQIENPNVTVCCQKSVNIPLEMEGKLGGQLFSYGDRNHNRAF